MASTLMARPRTGAPNPCGRSRVVSRRIPLPRVGIALGGGSARGWAHTGVLSALLERGIEPGIVRGTSIGALVGGIYAAGKLDELETRVRKLTRRDVLALVDLTVGGGGVIGGRRLMNLYRRHLGKSPSRACRGDSPRSPRT